METINTLLENSGTAQFVLLLLLTVLACSKVTIQGRACRGYIRNSQDSMLYNTMFFACVAVAVSIVFPLCAPTKEILFMAALSGILNAAFQILYSVSLTTGPVSLTVLVINFSVLFPTSLSIFAFKDDLYFTQLFGIAFLIASMLLSFNKTDGEQKASKKWLILTLICLITNGAAGCLQKVFYATETAKIENSENTFLVFTYVFATVIAIAVYFLRANTGKKEKSTFWFSKNVLFYAVAVGVIIAIFQKMFMLGVEYIDGTLFYPTYYGLQSVAMAVIGVILFKDHLTFRQKMGVLCGVLSIALMNLKIGNSVTF